VSVWIRGLGGLRPVIELSAGSRSLGTAVAGRLWRPVRVPVAALRGRSVTLTIASSDGDGLQLAYIGTVQRSPGLRVRRFVPAKKPGRPVGVVVTGSRVLIGVGIALEQLRGSDWRRVAFGRLKPKGARVRLTVKLPRHAVVRAVFSGSESVAPGVSPVRTRSA